MKCHHCGAPLEPVCSYCNTRHVRVVKTEIPIHVYTKPNPRGFIAQLKAESC